MRNLHLLACIILNDQLPDSPDLRESFIHVVFLMFKWGINKLPLYNIPQECENI